MTAGPAIDTSVSFIAGLDEIADRYDVILCDVWGVLHNGLVAYAAAAEALTRFRAQRDGAVVLLSNAPRPGWGVVRQLDRLGVPRTAYDAVVTSGDLARQAVIDRRGQSVHHIGPERDKPIFAGLDLRLAPIETADYVVCSGLRDDERETVEDYRPGLEILRTRRAPMICANPDLVVERGHRLIPCAGAIGLAYEEMGGAVLYAGKPHPPVYEVALSVAANILHGRPLLRPRVLALGDAIRTDIAGAVRVGLPSLLVARGIHANEMNLDARPFPSSHVQDWLGRQEARPDWAMETLIWS
jgi:HAD superfamily hydrolase (TIGR01459 family)